MSTVEISKPIILLGDKKDAETGEKIVDFFTRTEQSTVYEPKLLELGLS